MAAIAPLNTLVRPWVKGQKITEPGIYSGVPMELYHGDLCDGPSVSRSVLWEMDETTGGSPRHAWAKWYGNPNRKEQPEKPHFALGRAIHHLAGGEAQFAKHFAVRPAVWDSWRTKDAKAWRAEQERLGMGVLTAEDVDVIQGIADAMNEHPTIQAGILKGLVEMTVVWRDPVTGLWVKVRPDVLPLDGRMIVDLKTTAKADRMSCLKAIGEYGYHMQMAMIDEGLWQVAGWAASDHVDVFVEKAEPFCINLKPIPSHAIDYGRRQYRRNLDQFAACLEAGDWPGYADDEVDGDLPDWMLKRLSYESEKGILPQITGRAPRAPENDAARYLSLPCDDEAI